MKHLNPTIMSVFMFGMFYACGEYTPEPKLVEEEIVNASPDSTIYTSILGSWKIDSIRDVYESLSTQSFDTIVYKGAIDDGVEFTEDQIKFVVFSDSVNRTYEEISEDSLRVKISEEYYIIVIDSLNENKLVMTEIYHHSLDFVNDDINLYITHYLTKDLTKAE